MMERIMKLLLLFSGLALSVSLAAQYPSSGIKSRLGWQTTGDGLVYRGSGAPAYSPGTMFNAWMYLDTTNYTLYMYRNFQWTKLPLVNNGLTLDGSYVQLGGSLVENTTVSTGTYDLLLGRTSGTNHAWINIYGSGGYAGLFNSYNSGALEAEITAGGGTASLLVENITDGGNSSIYVTKDGFQASYLHPVIGASFFKMDSTKFRIRGLVSYASHSAADAANTEYQLYQINNSRAVYVKNGATTSQDILGTGTTNRVPLWTATNTLGNSNIQDNNTVVSILNSKPFQLGQWTTAGRPTGTSGYMGWNTTLTGIDWYNGTRWATGLESTFARGTSTYIPYFDANGQITQSSALTWNQSISQFTVNGTFNLANLQATSAVNIHNVGGVRFSQNTAVTGTGFRTDNSSGNWYRAANGNATASGSFIYEVTGNGTMGPQNNAKFLQMRGKFSSSNAPAAGAAIRYMSIEPEYSYTNTNAYTQYGIDYNPVLTGTTNPNLTHVGLRIVTGNVLLNTTSGNTGVGTSSPTEKLHVSDDLRVGDSLRVDAIPNQSAATKILTADGTGWVGYRNFSDFTATTLYSGNGTIGGSRIATLTDSLRIRYSGSDIFRIKSNGVISIGMPTESYSFVITNQPEENYNNYRGSVFMVGTASLGDTTTGSKRNNHEASYFSGINLVEGGNNVYYDAVSGYGNVIRSDQPKNIVYGVYNTVVGTDIGAYGYGNNVTGDVNTVLGIENTLSGSNSAIFGRGNTVSSSNSFVYGSNTSGTNLTLHGFGTTSPTARVHVKSISGSPTIYAEGGNIRFSDYGAGSMEAADLSKTQSNYIAGFATDGTVLDLERKRDTTIFVTADSDYDFSAAVTTAQIGSRYNRVIIHMTLTSGASADKTTTLHTPDANLMQCEFVIRGTDNNGSHTNDISFGTNNAISSDGTNASGYTLSAGQGLHVRVVYNGSAYKYIYY